MTQQLDDQGREFQPKTYLPESEDYGDSLAASFQAGSLDTGWGYVTEVAALPADRVSVRFNGRKYILLYSNSWQPIFSTILVAISNGMQVKIHYHVLPQPIDHEQGVIDYVRLR